MDRVPSKQRSDQAARTAANVTDLLGDPATPGVLVALAALEGVREQRRRGSWVALCPVHDDYTTPNLCIDVTNNCFGRLAVQFRCVSCGANGEAVLAALGLSAHAQIIFHRGKEDFAQQRPKHVAPLPSAQQLDEWRSALQADEERWQYVTEVRGVAPKIAHQFRLGWDEADGRYTLPVWGEGGRLVNVRRYDPNSPEGHRKMINTNGYGKPARLYPYLPPSGARRVYVTEGEWDALVARSNGLTAFSGTHGADTWLPEWSAALAGRPVVFLYDCDDRGREGAAKAAASVVAASTKSVRVVNLGLEEHGDVSDWFASGRTVDDLRVRINATPIAGAGQGGGRHG
ncbi:MAG TPA: hypothetical protein VNS19_09035 [Acidimicrobiales bacterium]|nr:hypothetical protein [Acidimicrobiales bacterium]